MSSSTIGKLIGRRIGTLSRSKTVLVLKLNRTITKTTRLMLVSSRCVGARYYSRAINGLVENAIIGLGRPRSAFIAALMRGLQRARPSARRHPLAISPQRISDRELTGP